jgi:hypothetical protein
MIEIQQHTFQKALQDVTHLNDISVGYLEQLTKQYPWFVSAHQLLAKKYQIMDNPKFNEQLQHAALLSFNRAELFNLIETDITPKKIIKTQKEEIKVEQKIAEPIVEMKVADVVPENKLVEVKEEIIELQPQVELVVATEIVEPIINVTEEKVELEPNKVEKLEVLEKEFEIKKIELPEIKEVEIKQVVVEEIKTPIITKVEQQKPKLMATEMKVEKEKVTTVSMNNAKEENPKSFTSWLKKFSKGSNIGEEKVIEPKPTAKKSSDIIAKIEEGYEDVDDNEVDELKVNLAELSTFSMQQHDEFVTETMAKIFEQQEKYEKAISTYEKLSLLKPEKSVFFASRIAEIKNKIK